MAVLGLGRGQLLAAALLLLAHQAHNAPVSEEGASQALQVADGGGDGRGCYYNFERYDEGDRILTNEPCLNCTCHNRMLMCYLRVCPFTKAIGQDCTVEKRPDQCCPVITCPQVPVALLTSSTTSERPHTTALAQVDDYGCMLEGNTFYADGAQVPSDPKKPCQLCYCIRNHTACVMQECTLNVEGCKPVYQEGVCCPVRYDCDYNEVPTTPKPVGLVTTPGGSSDCFHNGHYRDGEMVEKDETAPCEHCYCMRGDIVCAVQECGTPLEGRDCTPLERTQGQCCPNYQCANRTEAQEPVISSTEKINEESGEEKQSSSESSSESDSSSEESQEVSTETDPPKASEPVEEQESQSPQEPSSTEIPEKADIPEESPATEASPEITESPPPQSPEYTSAQSIKTDENTFSTGSPLDDSHPESSQHEVTQAQVAQDIIKKPQVTNEIPPLVLDEEAEATTTEGPVFEAPRIPGEGSCLVEGKTYAHNTIVPTENPCQEVCRCFSSIVSCKPRDCPPAPSPDEQCMPVTIPGACCPTYMCDQKTSDAPEVQDHKIETSQPQEPSYIEPTYQTAQPPAPEELPATHAPVVVGIPPESLIPGGNEHDQTEDSHDKVSDISHNESGTEHDEDTGSHSAADDQHPVDDNSHMNANIVHGHDASLHGGQPDHLDSQENGNPIQPASDITTIAPESGESDDRNEEDHEHENVVTSGSYQPDSQTEQTNTNDEQEVLKHPTDSPSVSHDEITGQETHSSESDSHNTYDDSEEPQIVATTEINVSQESESGPQPLPDENISSTSEAEAQEEISSSEETKTEATVSTDSPVVDEAASENEAPQSPVVEDSSGSETANADTSDSHQNENQAVTQDPQPEKSFETTISPITHDNIPPSEGNNDYSEQSHLDENVTGSTDVHIPTERPEEHDVTSDTQESGDDVASVTTISPEDNQASASSHDIEESSGNVAEQTSEEVKDRNEGIPTDSSPVQQAGDELPTTVRSSYQEEQSGITEETIHSDSGVSHDHEQEPSQQNAEIGETVEQTSHEESGSHENEKEEIEHGSTESDRISEDLNQSTSPPLTNEQEKPAQVPDESEQGQLETENATESGEPGINVIEEQKQQEMPSPGPVITEEATTPPSLESSADSSHGSQDELFPIIHEEVKVTGKPTIESQVTEENSVPHHEEAHIETTTQALSETHDTPIPGSEGIPIEKEPTLINESNNQDSIPVQTEEQAHISPSPEVGGSEDKPSEEISESVPAESSEATPEATGEKEAVNHIPSDNTAQLINDIDAIIQNEVNNQLFPGGQQTHVPTHDENSSQQTAGVTAESEQSLHNEEQQTSATPIVEEHGSEGVEESSSPSLNDNKDNSQEEITVVTESDISQTLEDKEKEPASNQPEVHNESEVTSETITNSPPSISSDPELEKQPEPSSTDAPQPEDNHNQSQTESPLTEHQEGNEDSQPSEIHVDPGVPEHSQAVETTEESANENRDNINEPSTELVPNKISETEQNPIEEQDHTTDRVNELVEDNVSGASSHTESTEKKPELVNEDQNIISGDISHVVNSDSQVPDSANQILENASDNISSTEQTNQEPEGDSVPQHSDSSNSQVPVEDIPSQTEQESSAGGQPQEEENAVSNEGNNISPGNEHATQTVDQESSGTNIQSQPEVNPPIIQQETSQPQETPVENQGGIDGDAVQEASESSQSGVTEASEDVTNGEQETYLSQTNLDSEKLDSVSDHHEAESEKQEAEPVVTETSSENQETSSEHQETSSEHQETSSEHQETSSEHQETVPENHEVIPELPETEAGQDALVHEHHDSESLHHDTSSSPTVESGKDSSTAGPSIESTSEAVSQGQDAVSEDSQKPEATEKPHKVDSDEGAQKIEIPVTISPENNVSEVTASSNVQPSVETQKPEPIPDLSQTLTQSTETASFVEAPSSTYKPLEEPSPMFPSWSQKPFDHHTTPEPHPPEENPYPSGFDPEYEDEEGVSYGPGTCRYGGKVYLSAQQIPRDDPCDFCFCFRSDIICLQQSCPPPIRGCYQETIKGFCCPRYECHVSMATMLNVTTTTTTTTTTLPPHFFAHAYNGAATKAGCQVKGVAYHVGERIPSTSGPCLECRCGANGQMKCDPTVCGPQEALLRQVMDAAVNRRRR